MFYCYLLFDNAELLGKYSAFIEKIHPNIIAISALDVKQVVPNHNEINILISNEFGMQSIGGKASLFNKSYILKKDCDELVENIHYLDPKYIITKMGTYLLDFIHSEIKSQQYIPISIKKLKYTIHYPCSFFIKLNRDKYLKVSNTNETIDESILQKLIFKGAKYLYVLTDEYSHLIKSLTNTHIHESHPKTKTLEKIKAVEAIHEYIIEIGFDPKIIYMTKSLHKSLEDKFKTKFMTDLLQVFSKMEGSFLYNHSYLTSVLALTVGKKFTWMNYDNREKIYLGSILHDLGFTEKENALYENMSRGALETLNESQKMDILNHPIKFAQKLAQVQNMHQDVIQIVRDHHGVHEENSYPKTMRTHEINLIFALFVLSHEFSLKLYSISFNPKKINEILNQLIMQFDKGSYKKILPEFKTTIEDIFLKNN